MTNSPLHCYHLHLERKLNIELIFGRQYRLCRDCRAIVQVVSLHQRAREEAKKHAE